MILDLAAEYDLPAIRVSNLLIFISSTAVLILKNMSRARGRIEAKNVLRYTKYIL